MDPQPPSSPETRSGSAEATALPAAQAARRFPKPPPLPVRFLMLCLRPESWAEAARYPSRYTVFPILLAILVAGIAVGIAETTRGLADMRNFARQYDQYYPALEYADGSLRATRDLPEPIRFDRGGATVLVDPTGKTSPDNIKSGVTFFIGERDAWLVTGSDSPSRFGPLPLSTLFPTDSVPFTAVPTTSSAAAASGPAITAATAPAPVRIDSQSILSYVDHNALSNIVGGTLLLVLMTGAVNLLWSILMMLLICPLVLLGAAGPKIGDGPDRRLILPRRAAYRIAGAVLVPLIVFGGVMHAINRPIAALIGFEASTLFWFFSAAAMALWAGILAKRLYAPTQAPRRAT